MQMGACFAKKQKEPDDTLVFNNSPILWSDTVPFVPPVSGGTCIKVYDGDTITVATRLPFQGSPLYRFSVRLNGIDTPEIKGKPEDEKKLAVMARDALSARILNKEVELKNVALEKYGRLLAQVHVGKVCYNDWLLENRYAVEYSGGTKVSPSNWMKFHKTGKTV